MPRQQGKIIVKAILDSLQQGQPHGHIKHQNSAVLDVNKSETGTIARGNISPNYSK